MRDMIDFGKIGGTVRNLFPGYFALAMATGIVSIITNAAGLIFVSRFLFIRNIFMFLILVILLTTRVIFYFPYLRKDIASYEKGPGFLTVVAGSGVLGVQFVLLTRGYLAASILWFFAITVWTLLMCIFFVNMIMKSEKPALEKGLTGIWLLMIVSTQSIAILGCRLMDSMTFQTRAVLFFNFSLFLLGCVLYLIVIVLIFYRITFFAINPEESAHSYWINTGAAAISVVSGITLSEKISTSGFYIEFIPFIKGMALMLWITGTWWIPAIIFLEIWRYFVKKVPFQYDPIQWSPVFVTGMYCLATLMISKTFVIQLLRVVSHVFLVLAMFLWILVFLGMISKAISGSRKRV